MSPGPMSARILRLERRQSCGTYQIAPGTGGVHEVGIPHWTLTVRRRADLLRSSPSVSSLLHALVRG